MRNRGPDETTEEHVFENVFFDLNKAVLRQESQIELNLFARYLNENPSIKIELGGHTDSRGNQEKNNLLSEQRAGAVYTYLIKKGISAERITFKGYGSSLPLFTDERIEQMNTSKEKEAAHQQNRRTAWREIF